VISGEVWRGSSTTAGRRQPRRRHYRRHHLFRAELDAACKELARVVRPSGTLVVGIGDPGAMAKMPFTAYGFTLRPVTDVIAALERSGFTVERRELPNPPIPHHLLIARLT
jgi:arsenite methyltransferase